MHLTRNRAVDLLRARIDRSRRPQLRAAEPDVVAVWRLRAIWRAMVALVALGGLAGVVALASALIRAGTGVERGVYGVGILLAAAICAPLAVWYRQMDLRFTTESVEIPGVVIPWSQVEEVWFDGAAIWFKIPTRKAAWNGWQGVLRIGRSSYVFSGADYRALRERLPGVASRFRPWKF